MKGVKMTEAKAKTKADPVINWKSFQKNTLDMLPVKALKGRALWMGIFVYIYLGLGGGFITSCLFLNINPTLILSIIGAPIWIGLVFLTKKITDIVYEYTPEDTVIKSDDTNTNTKSNSKD